MGMKLMQEMSTVETYSVRAARYLPMTMPVMVTGAVRSSCSVRPFLSSANRRMVKRGMRMMNAKIM